MKAIRVHSHGGPDVLTLEDVGIGKPGPGEVLQGATIFHAKVFAKALLLYSHQ